MINVGQRLQQERLAQGKTLDDVAKATKIRVSFLSAIEKNEYHKLPSPAYTQGFVANYAEYLKLPKRELMAIFRREFDVNKAYKVLPTGMAQPDEFPVRRFHIQQTLFVIAGVFLLIGGYFFWQYQQSTRNPMLTVTSPQEGAVSDQDIVIKGKTDTNATVVVNNEPVSLNTDGTFTKQLTAFPGKVVITVKATSRYGKETNMIRTVQVKE